MSSTTSRIGLALALAGASGFSCNKLDPSEVQGLAGASSSLFADDGEEDYARFRRARQAAGEDTRLTDGIQWAATLDEAFSRGMAEDKPVMLATFVRENGDPHCDV